MGPALLTQRLTSDAFDAKAAQTAAFIAAPIFFTLSIVAVGRFAATPGELVSGVLAAIAATLGLVVLGVVLPRSR